jgi:hypothetical protein
LSEQRSEGPPYIGKTYSLYGGGSGTSRYYDQIKDLADLCLRQFGDEERLLAFLQRVSGRKRLLRKQAQKPPGQSQVAFLLNALGDPLSIYTTGVERHLRTLSFFRRWERTLATTLEQYHLHMLEIEITNRIFAQRFRQCEYKIALLPHCLRDLARKCRAAPDGLDYTCKGCSKVCLIHAASDLVKRYRIHPYIWMEAGRRKLFKVSKAGHESFGVLGIACIPELVAGMRLCQRYDLPVVGIPLDANRCVRWFGRFHDNSVNLEKLEDLIR